MLLPKNIRVLRSTKKRMNFIHRGFHESTMLRIFIMPGTQTVHCMSKHATQDVQKVEIDVCSVQRLHYMYVIIWDQFFKTRIFLRVELQLRTPNSTHTKTNKHLCALLHVCIKQLAFCNVHKNVTICEFQKISRCAILKNTKYFLPYLCCTFLYFCRKHSIKLSFNC